MAPDDPRTGTPTPGTMTAAISPDDSFDDDPRKQRSRGKLLDAAAALVTSGGIDAVTIEAVTRMSKVARTTLYRHFGNVMQLRAAVLERFLLPPVTIPESEGPLRDRLIELVHRQAVLIDDAPLQISMLTWIATGDAGGNHSGPEATSLHRRIIEQYRRPFDDMFAGPDARDILGDYDVTTALARLIGPVVFVRLAGLGRTTHADCIRIVDDFLAARAAATTRPET